MQEHGDLFLKVFHKHNFTYSAHVDFQTLLQQIESAGDSDSRDLLALLNEQLVKRLFQVMLDLQRDPRIVRDKYLQLKRAACGGGKGKEGRKEVVRHKCRRCCLGEEEDAVVEEGRVREVLEKMPGECGLEMGGGEE
jgi:hypothetical protein